MFDVIFFWIVAGLIVAPWVAILYPYLEDSLRPTDKEEE
jgi:hypothetical protein